MEPNSLNRLGAVLLAAALLSLVATPANASLSSRSLTLNVYDDGYVHVEQVLSVGQQSASVQVPLVSANVYDLVATDQNGNPLSYNANSGGGNITVYTLGATAVTLRYDTDNLTTKTGTVWTLAYTARYNSTVVLPQLSTLLSASGTPYSISENNTSPILNVSPGTWKLSYGVPLGSTTSTTGSSQGGGAGSDSTVLLGLALAGAAAVVVVLLFWWRRRTAGLARGELRPDDAQVLTFIQEKGGRALELEIRMRFALPKTSAWRQIKRLERLGYVKVTKMGSQNQIELRKDRNAAT